MGQRVEKAGVRERAGSSAPTPRPGLRLLTWAVTLVSVVAALAAIALAISDRPRFCGVCHEMKPSVDGWSKGDHADNAECMDCHADRGAKGYVDAHVVDGIRDLYIHFIRGAPRQVPGSYVPQRRCLRCHENAFSDPGFKSEHADKTAYCPDCHRDRIHANPRPSKASARAKGGAPPPKW